MNRVGSSYFAISLDKASQAHYPCSLRQCQILLWPNDAVASFFYAKVFLVYIVSSIHRVLLYSK